MSYAKNKRSLKVHFCNVCVPVVHLASTASAFFGGVSWFFRSSCCGLLASEATAECHTKGLCMSQTHQPYGRRPCIALNLIYSCCHDCKKNTRFPRKIVFNQRCAGVGAYCICLRVI